MNTTSGIVRDLLGNYHLGACLTDDDILKTAEGILEHKLMRSGETLTDPAASARYLKAKLAGYPYEVFAALFLDNRHRVIAFEELFRGSIDGCSVHPREVIRRCIFHNAAAVIFAHNHPSGVAEPSAADRSITQRLKEALEFIDVRALDHFVIGGSGTPTSLAQRGWM
jgi:DNA repair protein RadC